MSEITTKLPDQSMEEYAFDVFWQERGKYTKPGGPISEEGRAAWKRMVEAVGQAATEKITKESTQWNKVAQERACQCAALRDDRDIYKRLLVMEQERSDELRATVASMAKDLENIREGLRQAVNLANMNAATRDILRGLGNAANSALPKK